MGFFTRTSAFLREAAQRFSLPGRTKPIETVEALSDFIASRAAFISQKKLYGYLKTRMGTRYPEMFRDDVFMASVDIAKLHVFAAALSDLCIHCVARIVAPGGLEEKRAAKLALHCFDAALAENAAQIDDDALARGWRDDFLKRVETVNWQNAAAGGDCFTTSHKALVHWAPIADELKKYDRQIVENSIRFAFVDVARSFREAIRAEAVAQDWRDMQ